MIRSGCYGNSALLIAFLIAACLFMSFMSLNGGFLCTVSVRRGGWNILELKWTKSGNLSLNILMHNCAHVFSFFVWV